ncbi:MAG: type II secretion system F family protein [Thermoleophilaceae bacterium]
MISAEAGLAFAAVVLGVLAAAQLAAAPEGLARAPKVARLVAALVDALVRVGSEGHDPGAVDRRRLLLAGAVLGVAGGLLLAGPHAGLALGAGGPFAASRVLRARREHYRRAVERDAAAVAVAMADALGAGRSLRGAVTEAGRGLGGAAGHELRRVAGELAAGAPTDDALEAMRVRVRSARLDTVVAACLVQRRAGGDLATLLREIAEAFGDQARLEDEVRSATAQARFTGLVVVLMPVGGAGLSELASPGFLIGLWSSFLTAWLVGIALVLQLGAAVLIRRLGRVRW